ncbi:MAG: hypothetical protein J5997_10635, partial [Oscillospiraceae bacterium]|nr:hypothetical protein [Oscillospiraceae bacterium]
KGQESGNTFTLHRILVNCEQNSLVFIATPTRAVSVTRAGTEYPITATIESLIWKQ